MWDAQEQDAFATSQADTDFLSLMGRREFRRLWWASIDASLFRGRIALDSVSAMSRAAVERDLAAKQWAQARRICPELVIQAMREADERASGSGTDATN